MTTLLMFNGNLLRCMKGEYYYFRLGQGLVFQECCFFLPWTEIIIMHVGSWWDQNHSLPTWIKEKAASSTVLA